MNKFRRLFQSARLHVAAMLLSLAVWLTPERGGHKARLLSYLIPYFEDVLTSRKAASSTEPETGKIQ